MNSISLYLIHTIFTISGNFIKHLSFLIPHTQVLTTREENIVLFHVNQTLCENVTKQKML